MQYYYDVVFQSSSAPELGLILDGLDKLGLKVIRQTPRSLRIAVSNQQDDLLDYVLELPGVDIVERVSLPTHMSTDLLKPTSEKEVRFYNFIFQDNMPESKNQDYSVLFGSEDEVYSDEGEDVSGHPVWKPMLEVAAKFGPPLGQKVVISTE